MNNHLSVSQLASVEFGQRKQSPKGFASAEDIFIPRGFVECEHQREVNEISRDLSIGPTQEDIQNLLTFIDGTTRAQQTLNNMAQETDDASNEQKNLASSSLGKLII